MAHDVIATMMAIMMITIMRLNLMETNHKAIHQLSKMR